MMTWGRRAGDHMNPTLYPNFTVMQDRLEDGYLAYAENLTTRDRPVYVAPVGLAFRRVHDDIAEAGGNPLDQGSLFSSLYSSDGSHPSLRGSYLAACVLHATLTGNSPVGLDLQVNIPSSIRDQLERAANATVFVDADGYERPVHGALGARCHFNRLSANGIGMTVGCRAATGDVTHNIFDTNHGPAVLVMGAWSGPNRFVYNAFNDNNGTGWQVEDPDHWQIWSHFYPVEVEAGNWWSDYEERYPNATNDGRVWDTPYMGLDQYPMVSHPAFSDRVPPVADAGADVEVPEGTLVELNGLNSSDNKGIRSYRWTFTHQGEEEVLHGPVQFYWFDEVGTHEVTLNVSDAAGNWDADTVNVTVLDVTDPRAVIHLQQDHFFQHDNVTMNGTRSFDNVGVVSWSWEFSYNGTLVQLEGPVVSWTFDVQGDHMVMLTVHDAAGNRGTDSAVVRVRDTEPPSADAGPDQEVAMGDRVRFDGGNSTDNAGIRGYAWTFTYAGQTVKLIGPTPTFEFNTAGEYTVFLKVVDVNILEDTDTMTVRVADTEPPEADGGRDRVVNQGVNVGLVGSYSTDNVGVTEWWWAIPWRDNLTLFLEGEVVDHTFDDPGRYRVVLTVSDARGNRDTDEVWITVLDIEPPVADAGPDRTVDMGVPFWLDGSNSTDNVGVAIYSWYCGVGGVQVEYTGARVPLVYEEPGFYEVKLSVLDEAGNADLDRFVLMVRDTLPPKVPSFDDVSLDRGESLRLDGSGASDNVGIVNWTWTIKNGGDPLEIHRVDADHVFQTTGTYRVTLTVRDADGNEASTSFEVSVRSSTLPIVLVLLTAVILLVLVFFLRQRRPRDGGGGRGVSPRTSS
jgi:PKD repeat protein